MRALDRTTRRAYLRWPDFLESPLGVLELADRQAALAAYIKPRERLQWVSMAWAILGLVSAVVASFFTSHNDAVVLDILLASVIPMVPGALLSVMLSAREMMRRYLEPVAIENTAELGWLLENVPEAQALMDAVAREPRSYLHGELKALQYAWRERKASGGAQ